MLSNPALYEYGVFDYLPVERLVVDEASQIDTFEFMVSILCLSPYRSTAEKSGTAPVSQLQEAEEGVHVRGPEAA